MTEALLSVEGLSKSFGALQATDDVSLTVKPGEIHGLIGPNGAGKTTLIQQISGNLAPDAGRVVFNERDVTALNVPQRVQAGLGRTFQISSLALEFTVLQNVVLGALGATHRVWRFFRPVLKDAELVEKAVAALEQVGLADKARVPTAELSHGQRRLLEVAVALTLEPRLFLMDEPMAGLGTEGSVQMTGFLDRLRQRAPILLIEHDMEAVFALADRISVLVYGRIIATGTADEIRENSDVQRAYLGEEGQI